MNNFEFRGPGFIGNISFDEYGNPTFPPNCVGDKQMNPGDPGGYQKNVHKLVRSKSLNGTVAAGRYVLHIALAAGSILNAKCVLEELGISGDSTITIDIKRNGTSILNGGTVLTLNSTNASGAGTILSFNLNNASLIHASGDIYTAVITPTVGTGTLGKGLSIQLALQENP